MMSSTSDLADKILASKRRGNHPCHNGESGKRLVGWIMDEDVVGLSDGLFAIEEIEKRAASSQRSSADSAQPKGWKLVPIKPDKRQIAAGRENNPTQWTDETPDTFSADVANDVYVSMVTAAPTCTEPQTASGQNDLDQLASELEEWIRQPDWGEDFSLQDLADWASEKRPIHIVQKMRDIARRCQAESAND
jgi:hypothetical protein